MARPKKETAEAIEAENEVEQVQDAPKKPAKHGKSTTYTQWDKWKVEVTAIQVPDDAPDAEYKLMFIKPYRTGIKIAERNAIELNSQTQNNSVYFVPSGSKTNGDEITIKVSRGKHR